MVEHDDLGDDPTPDAPAPALVATVLTLSASPDPSASGALVTVTAVVTAPGGSAPTGAVMMCLGDARAFVTVPLPDLDNQPTASFAFSALPPGTHAVTAWYSGDETYAPSPDCVLALTVGPAPPTIPTHAFLVDPAARTLTLPWYTKTLPAPAGTLVGWDEAGQTFYVPTPVGPGTGWTIRPHS